MTRLLQRDSLILAVLIVIGLLLRLDFLWPCNFVIDADEAIVGLMAKHINEGQPVPIFYYGQHYMGSFEPILTSFIFYFFGVSSLTLKIVPLFFSLLLIILVYFLGKQLEGRRTGLLAALFCAVPPTTLVVWSGKARGGFIELLVIGAAALLAAGQWLAPGGIKFSRTMLVGLLLGFGWWVNNQIIFFVLAIGFCFLARLLRLSGKNFLTKLLIASEHLVVGSIAFLIGGFPFWIYNLNNQFVSFEMFGSSKGSDVIEHLSGLFSISIPIILGAKRFWESNNLFTNSTIFYYVIYGFIFLVLFFARKKNLAALCKFKLSKNPQIEMLILFLLSCFAVFSFSSFGYLVQAPRYLLPVYVGLFPLIAYTIVKIDKYSSVLSVFLVVMLLSFNLASSYAYGRAIPGEPFVFKQQRVARDHTELINWLDKMHYSWVRTNYWIGYRLAFETKERIKFDLFQEPVQVRIESYRQDAIKYGEDRMPFVLVPAQAELVKNALTALAYSYKEAEVDGYKIIYDIQETKKHFFEVLDSSKIQINTNYNQENAAGAIDKDLNTRWGSAHHQSEDMQFAVNINEPTLITGVHYDMGRWPQDWPRSLRIEVVTPTGEHMQVFDDNNFRAVSYLFGNNQMLSIFFQPVLAKQIILYQLGKDAVFDWSIAEIALYRSTAQ